MKNLAPKLIIFLMISWISLQQILFAQPDNTMKNINVEGGVMMDAQMEFHEFMESFYIAPALRLNRHECYAGLWIITSSRPGPENILTGGIAGYRFYIFREPSRMNVYGHYSFRYYHQSGLRYYYNWNALRIDSYRWKSNTFMSTLGPGFSVNFDRKGYVAIFSELGYTVEFSPRGFKCKFDTYWSQLNVTLGLKCKLANLQRKSG